jgi:hypothetical protein
MAQEGVSISQGGTIVNFSLIIMCFAAYLSNEIVPFNHHANKKAPINNQSPPDQ